ncbi:unnamed protein product [Arabis nemorensis]|uniref:Uncharacterized protein n=1 Tax=Arabis nemorensis TaxID=586526 RepID=A0A565CVG0_9BRAS|nr:unnamed protein product [Arabis nemorensis]
MPYPSIEALPLSKPQLETEPVLTLPLEEPCFAVDIPHPPDEVPVAASDPLLIQDTPETRESSSGIDYKSF